MQSIENNNNKNSQQQQQLPPLIWPMDPAKAFTLIACTDVPYTNTQNSTEKMREPPQPREKKSKKKDTDDNNQNENDDLRTMLNAAAGATKEQVNNNDEKNSNNSNSLDEEEEEEKMPIEQRVKESMTRFRLSFLKKEHEQQTNIIEIGQQVELHLELSAVVSRYEKHFLRNEQQQEQEQNVSSSSTAKNKNNNIEDLPEEAMELHRRVKIGPIRWEAENPATGRFVPAAPCSRVFPFRDTHFNPTSDHLGLRMRALCILQDVETDQVVMFQNEHQQVRPSVIASDYFQIVPSNQMKQVMEIANHKGQIGCFAKEKHVVVTQEEEQQTTEEDDHEESEQKNKSVDENKKEKPSTKEEDDEKLQKKLQELRKEYMKQRTVEGDAILIACKKFDDHVGIRIMKKGNDEEEEQKQQQGEKEKDDKAEQQVIIYEGTWKPLSDDAENDRPVSLCSLFVGDDVTMTIHFTQLDARPVGETTEGNDSKDDVQVIFKNRLDRDIAAAGMRSLM